MQIEPSGSGEGDGETKASHWPPSRPSARTAATTHSGHSLYPTVAKYMPVGIEYAAHSAHVSHSPVPHLPASSDACEQSRNAGAAVPEAEWP